MTDQEIRIAIAVECGWKPNESRGFVEIIDGVINWLLCRSPQGQQLFIPNYPNDLNAIHEAEKKLVLTYHRVNIPMDICTNEASRYRKALREICERDGDNHTIHATARQRAEAFLRTIGKWTE